MAIGELVFGLVLVIDGVSRLVGKRIIPFLPRGVYERWSGVGETALGLLLIAAAIVAL